MRRLLVILSLLISSLSLRAEEVNVSEILFGHIGDSYGWHITEWNGEHVIIPLPCIVRSSTGWHFFMSSKIEHGHEYEGLFIAHEGRYADKIVERGADGELIRPFDISITKNVASLMFSSILLVMLVLLSARWYRRHDVENEAPSGLAAALEPLIMMVNDELIKDNVGPDYKRYSPYLLTVIFFIFLNNLLGIVPLFPG
jgi:F-type H+-transporting ATPase subunit a